jgi:hypothetical protein
MLTHVVLFKHKSPEPAQIAETVARLRALEGAVPTLRGLEVGTDVIRSERSYDVGLIARFDDRAGLAAYQAHPAHLPVLDYVNEVMASRVAVDFES